jgi:hypothetical protein
VPAALIAGHAAGRGITTATLSIVHAAPKFLRRPIGFHANRFSLNNDPQVQPWLLVTVASPGGSLVVDDTRLAREVTDGRG